MLIAYLITIAMVAVLTIIAIKLLPKIDKSFKTTETLLSDSDCTLEDTMLDLKIVNKIELYTI